MQILSNKSRTSFGDKQDKAISADQLTVVCHLIAIILLPTLCLRLKNGATLAAILFSIFSPFSGAITP